jgi:exonuclease SbcC
VTDAGLARLRHEEARAAAQDARHRHEEAARAAERRRRRDTALAALAELQASEPADSAAREAVGAHHRAHRCRPLLDLVDRARSAHEQACHAQARALTSLDSRRPTSSPPHSIPLDPTGALDPGVPLTALIEQVRSRIARLEALLPREQLAAAARRERDADQARLHAAERDLSEVELRTDTVPVEIESRVVALADAAARAAPQATVRSLLATARDRHAAAVQLAEVSPALRTLDDRRRAARDRMQDAREQQLAVVARRLAGMAAELAGELEHGAACQVCGSTEHPRRAEPSVGAVTEHDQRRAERDLAAANAALDAADEVFLELRRRHDGLVVASAGLGVEEAAAQVALLDRAAAEAETARLEQSRLEDELRELRDEQAVLGRRQAAAAASVAALRESLLGHDRTLDAVAVEIAHALGDAAGAPPPESLTAAVARLTAWCEVLVEAQHATAQLEAAETRLADAIGQAHAAATGQGFASLADLEAAQLADGMLRQLEGRLRQRADEESRVRAVLDDPEIAGMVGDPVNDLAPLVDATDATAAEASRMLALHEDRAAALGGLLDRLETAMRAWAPLRDESLRAASISKLVRGMGHDNELQMRLSAYVLATRLDQVVAAANERLGHMRDQRYLLQRTGRAERRSAQAGLGLEIVDQWTGDVRAPATLSGGETFVVSLSLALGLADVVTHESGGTEIETLFVDEGFGTLDADTLDDVMDRLDGLRAGGRTVGVVSHVTELRSRIPTQVHVDKGRAGSTVTVHTLVG